MAYTFPSGTNTFVPSFEASGKLIINFSRNPKDFSINQWAAIKKVNKSTGYYLRLNTEEAARVLSSDGAEVVWHDGNDAPAHSWGKESFQFFSFDTTRYSPGFSLGYKAVEQADWKILAQHAAIKAQQMMTIRTKLAYAVLTDTTLYDSSHVDTFKNWAGGSAFSDAGSATSPEIKKALLKAAQQIHIDTLGTVGQSKLAVLIDPVVARKWASSQEVHTYLKESPYALAEVRGDAPNQNGIWGLPSKLYGFDLIVEDAVQTTSRKGATKAQSYIPGGNTAVVLTKPGELYSEAGGADFSTIQGFFYEEMTVETKDDPDNRRTKGRVVDDFVYKVVAPASGVIITNLFS